MFGACLLAVGIAGCSKGKETTTPTAELPPAVVSTAKVKSINYHPSIEAIGRLMAFQHAMLSSEIGGIIKSLHFESGQSVAKGATLIELNHEIDSAKLKEKEAQLKLAQNMYQRKKTLKKSLPAAEIDEAHTKLELAQYETELLKATISQKYLRAPFAGRLGFKQVEVGEYLSPGKAIANLQALNPLRVNFSIPEEYLPELKPNQKIEFTTEAYPNQSFHAKLHAIDVETGPSTHMVQVEGYVDNTHDKLYPGLFAKLKLYVGQTERVLAVPKTAINYSLYGNSVFKVLCQENHCQAIQQYVQLGNSIGDYVIIRSGLEQQDEVIISGQLKVQNQMAIAVNNDKPFEIKD